MGENKTVNSQTHPPPSNRDLIQVLPGYQIDGNSVPIGLPALLGAAAGAQWTAQPPSIAGASAPAPQEPSRSLVLPCSCPGAAVRHRQGKGKLINQPRSGISDSIGPKHGSSHLWKGHPWLLVQGKEQKFLGKFPFQRIRL